MALELNGRVLALNVDGHISKVVLPAGERGPSGRDGMSIRGDPGAQGPPGIPGKDGRDSMVPGPKGEQGEVGPRPNPTPIKVGKVLVGDEPHVSINVQGNAADGSLVHVMDLVIPRGNPGLVGRPGKDGKDGSHEYIKFLSIGHSPEWDPEFLGCHCVMDGTLNLPEFTAEDYGRWVWLKTFDRLVINNAMDGQFAIEKGQSAKMLVVPYAGKYVMTRF
jgi:hypothetical protein